MAAVTGPSAAISSDLQLPHKTLAVPSTRIDTTANNQSDEAESSDADGESRSSDSEDSDSGSNVDDLAPNVAIAPHVAPRDAPDDPSEAEDSGRRDAPAQSRMAVAQSVSSAPNIAPSSKGPASAESISAKTHASAKSPSQPSEGSPVAVPPSHHPSEDMSSVTQNYGRPIVPNGPVVDPYRSGKESTPGYRPKLLRPEDGRVTATIPHKLRAKINSSNGNFATIHMDLPCTSRHERSSAAQRSSEATVAAAAAANKAHEASSSAPQRNSEAIATSSERAGRPSHPRTKRQSAPADSGVSGYPQCYPPPVAAGFPSQLPHPLHTKTEQARLLTLLGTIHPKSIVDQLCKGLAWFGGVPGAPPPPNGAFPMSENHNGSGALFVNWLAEIFPPVHPASSGLAPGQSPFSAQFPRGNTPVQTSQAQNGNQSVSDAAPNHPDVSRSGAGPQMDTVVLPKRKRGRPKGSKSSKPRKDKGIKKGPNPNRVALNINTNGEPGVPPPADSSDPSSTGPQKRLETSTPQVTPSGKRRGRPPGSKNKPKPLTIGDSRVPIAQAAPVHQDHEIIYHRHDLVEEVSPTAPRPPAQSLSRSEALQQAQEGIQQSLAAVPGLAFTAPPAPLHTLAVSSRAPEPRKRKLSDSADAQESHNGMQLSTQQAIAPTENSQGTPNVANPQKRRRASNAVGSQDRTEEYVQARPAATSTFAVAPSINLNSPIASIVPGSQASSFGSSSQASRPVPGVRQPGGGSLHWPQQTPSLGQQQQAAALRPSQQQSGPHGKPRASTQQQRPSHVPQTWQRSMVGPQQAANPDAQPVAHAPMFSTHPPEQQRR